jgi:hypothetical protein
MLSVCEGGICTYLQQILLLEVLQLCRSGRISWAAMVLAPSVAGLFKWRQFEPEVILLGSVGSRQNSLFHMIRSLCRPATVVF